MSPDAIEAIRLLSWYVALGVLGGFFIAWCGR